MTRHPFPDGFVWGVASSAYQIEGSPLADGAGPSIQHRFAHTPGNTIDGGTGDVAADHYRRYRDDIALMAELGVRTYQFSIPWSRVLPDGVGTVNRRALSHYDALVDALLEAGIAPAPILHVWELPGVLQDQGGWANRDCADWFADFAAAVFDLVGDRATHWFTICEPQTIAYGGYASGVIAPAVRDLYSGLRAAHHLLLGHGRAVQAFRASGIAGEIGTSTGVGYVAPASSSAEDRAAAERYDAFTNDLYLDPILLGRYPDGLADWLGDAWPEIRDGDLATIATPIDFVGVTYYHGTIVADADSTGTDGELDRILQVRTTPAGHELPVPGTGFGARTHPEGLPVVLVRLRDRYDNPPIMISEYGAAFADELVDGEIDDQPRIDELRDHLIAAHQAIMDGIDLRGWFTWSLLDTWEFMLGFTARYGLVHVDYATQRRTVKRSGYWYRDVMTANAVESSPESAQDGTSG